MNCKSCGAPVDARSAFCESCGAKQDVLEAASPSPRQTVNPWEQPVTPQNNPWTQNAQPPQNNLWGQNAPPPQNGPPPAFVPVPVPVATPVSKAMINGILGIVLGVVCFFIFGFLSIAALACGITAISLYPREKRQNIPTAGAGLVLGIVATVIGAVTLILWIIALSNA